MDIHEYQAKIILRKYGVPMPEFSVFSNLDLFKEFVLKSGWKEAVLKVQVHAGGRGKAGGVKLARSPEEMIEVAKKLLGMKIINNQTGKDGIVANQILISPLVNFKKEYYLGAVIDRENARGVLIASPEGGVEIEEVAKLSPEKVLKWPLPLDGKLKTYELIKIAKFMGWTGTLFDEGKKIIAALAKCFVETDASLLEINPLVETDDGHLIALDAKLSVDDNALFRQKEISEFYDKTQLSKNDALAKDFDLAYIGLDGQIGCMVNGAGLAMATMDIIHYYGGKPANFLDVGGGASEDKVKAAFKIILADSGVKAILVNVFGGIMNCATLAAGIVAAASEISLGVPLVVRMEGTNVEAGKKILADSKLNIIVGDNLADAAKKVVAFTK